MKKLLTILVFYTGVFFVTYFALIIILPPIPQSIIGGDCVSYSGGKTVCDVPQILNSDLKGAYALIASFGAVILLAFLRFIVDLYFDIRKKRK